MTTCIEYWNKPESDMWLIQREIPYLLSDEFLSAKAKRWRHEDKEKLRQLYSHFEYQNDDHFKRHLWNNMADEKRCDGGHVIKTQKSSFYEFQAHCGVKDCKPCSKIRKDKAVAGREKGIPKQKAFYETEEGKAVKAAKTAKARETWSNPVLRERQRELNKGKKKAHTIDKNKALLLGNNITLGKLLDIAGTHKTSILLSIENGSAISDIGKPLSKGNKEHVFYTKEEVFRMYDEHMTGTPVGDIERSLGLLKSTLRKAFDFYGLVWNRENIGYSSVESSVSIWLSEAGIEHQRNFRPEWLKKAGKSHSMELDIYVESAKVAIEVNGRYWHTNARGLGVIDKDYHRYKFEKCMEQGIKLLQFTDKEVDDKPEVVKSIIHNALGISSEKVYARKCVLKDVDFDESSKFLDMNHLHGKGRPGKSIGLYYNDVLVSCLRYRAITDTVEIERFASLLGFSVVGAFSKLLKRVPGKVIISYSYNDIGHGNLYEKTGFSYVGEVKNSYRYWMPETDEFVHRSHWQKHKLLKVFGGDSSMTEIELAYENGIFAYYDSGYKKWSMTRQDAKDGHSS